MKLTVLYLHISMLLVPCIVQAHITDKQPTDMEKPTSHADKLTPKKITPTLDYSDPIKFMSDFLDTRIKPEKPLKYWALQLVLLLKDDPRLINFCHKIKNIATDRDTDVAQRTRGIHNAILDTYAKQDFPAKLSEFILSKTRTTAGREAVKEAIKQRVQASGIAPAA